MVRKECRYPLRDAQLHAELRDHGLVHQSPPRRPSLGVIYVSSVSINQTDTQCIQCISKPGAGLHTPATPLDAAPPPRSAGAPPPHPAHAHPRTRHYLHRTPTSPGAGSGAGDGDGASAEDEERDARSGLGFIARGFVTDDRYIDR